MTPESRYGGNYTEIDVATLDKALRTVGERFGSLIVVEVGMGSGNTARGIEHFVRGLGIELEYWGIEFSRAPCIKVPFPGAHLSRGDSVAVYPYLPEQIHLLILDGCGCPVHTIVEVGLYGSTVVPGGQMLVHQTVDLIGEHYTAFRHGDTCMPDSYCAPRRGLTRIGLLPTSRHTDWKLLADVADPDVWGSGFVVYEKTNAILEATSDGRPA